MIEQKIGSIIRTLRERRNLSLRAVAGSAGFSPAFLSQVEKGQASPSLASTERIAVALGVTLWQLFQVAETDKPMIVRADRRVGFSSGWSKADVELLNVGSADGRLASLLVTLRPNGASSQDPTANTTDEFAFVLKGKVSLQLTTGRFDLSCGDSATIRAGLVRRWTNESDDTAQILIVSENKAASG
jgi:XRE family transcriptional regulator, regulator of sulfur utilization